MLEAQENFPMCVVIVQVFIIAYVVSIFFLCFLLICLIAFSKDSFDIIASFCSFFVVETLCLLLFSSHGDLIIANE